MGSIQNVTRAGSGDAIAVLTLKTGLDQQQAQMARLLQALPPAPQPAHLGSQIDLRA